MNIWLENVDLRNNNGPNSFAQKIYKQFLKLEHSVDVNSDPEVILCFIESYRQVFDIPTVLRLDGVYFNTMSDWQLQNKNIRRTYDNVEGIIFQSSNAYKALRKMLVEVGLQILRVNLHTEIFGSVVGPLRLPKTPTIFPAHPLAANHQPNA